MVTWTHNLWINCIKSKYDARRPFLSLKWVSVSIRLREKNWLIFTAKVKKNIKVANLLHPLLLLLSKKWNHKPMAANIRWRRFANHLVATLKCLARTPACLPVNRTYFLKKKYLACSRSIIKHFEMATDWAANYSTETYWLPDWVDGLPT